MVHLDAFLEQITEVEKESDVSDVLELLSWFENLALDEWESLLTYEDGAPGNTILYQSEKVKIVLIYWKGKQKSSVHGHPGGGGLLRVLSGSLEETRYTPDDSRTLIDKSRLEAGLLGIYPRCPRVPPGCKSRGGSGRLTAHVFIDFGIGSGLKRIEYWNHGTNNQNQGPSAHDRDES